MASYTKSKEMRYLQVLRTVEGYILIDKIHNIPVMQVVVHEDATDDCNSKLRDALIKDYYEYGKAIGMYH